jgi:DUF971 family protein
MIARNRLTGALLDPERGLLILTWADGHESPIPLALLRRECPCASCRHYREMASQPAGLSILPREVANASPEIESIQTVGRYGMQPIWKDGHSTGIYTFDHLRGLCPCDACRASQPRDV